jgi:hypothetical protein
MTGARNDAVHVYKYLTNAGVPCGDIYGKDVMTKRAWTHDWIEMCLLIAIVVLSVVPAWVAAVQILLEAEGPSPQQTTNDGADSFRTSTRAGAREANLGNS